jgi:hypothetical protein
LADDPPPKSVDERKVLDYRTPEDRSVARRRAVGAATAGFLVSAAIIGFAGFVVFLPIGLSHPYPSGAPKHHWMPVVSFFLVALIAFMLAAYVGRTRLLSRFFLLGFLIGTGFLGLLEGVCFLPRS